VVQQWQTMSNNGEHVSSDWFARLGLGEPAGASMVEDVVLLAATAALLGALAWLMTSTAVCMLDAWRDGEGAESRGGAFRPRFVRGLVAIALTSAVSTGAAAQGPPELPGALDGLSVPDRPYGGVRTYQVHAGDSLWGLAASALPQDVTRTRVARSWRHVYRLNRGRIGPEPDLIHSGSTLRLPARFPVPDTGATR
jgi:nucleoid-associated protein YgaU